MLMVPCSWLLMNPYEGSWVLWHHANECWWLFIIAHECSWVSMNTHKFGSKHQEYSSPLMSAHGHFLVFISTHDRSWALMSRVPWHHYRSYGLMNIHEHWVMEPWVFRRSYRAIAPYSWVLMSAIECSWAGTHECLFVWFSNKRKMLTFKMTAS